ncbi:MAG: hypothetical protein H6689_00125 [Erysipelotrichaceae bacterium]|jgi:hypothetical protein|nr:hypothetical protein [Erysipelotrichaceae bacterium]MCB9499810.1 hypothetical protein [Erysipelotrichaceae bacterium]
MAKIQIKYLTKPNNEVMEHYKNCNVIYDANVLRVFLDDKNNFALMVYAFGKLNGFITLSNDETSRKLYVKDSLFIDYALIKHVSDFLTNKFKNYKIVFGKEFKNPHLINELRRNKAICKEGEFIICLY